MILFPAGAPTIEVVPVVPKNDPGRLRKSIQSMPRKSRRADFPEGNLACQCQAEYGGGHVSPHVGYHYHAVTDRLQQSPVTLGPVTEEHRAPIGIAMDGFEIFLHRTASGNIPGELDSCNGHEAEGVDCHYHAGTAGSNAILGCLTAQAGCALAGDDAVCDAPCARSVDKGKSIMSSTRRGRFGLIRKDVMEYPGVTMGLTLLSVAALWSASSYGYYALVSALHLESGYNDAPFVFTAYYLIWTGLALLWFRKVLAGSLVRRKIMAHAVAMAPLMLVIAIFVAVILPSLPPVSVWRAPSDPPEFMFASGWYYLPKSADILFQQVLVASLIYTAAELKLRLMTISIGMGLMFGGFHLLLALDGFLPLYVARFTIAASLFGLVVPYMYLRLKHGFRWAYGLHWSFYAFDAAVTHFVLAVPRWAVGIPGA
ncbi:MAG: YHYH protein [Hoeflea sp.]|uniref:YHYH protein n=1 Tax=Hoeflea sp. TaxID=1940281 RepID=UPI0032996D0F